MDRTPLDRLALVLVIIGALNWLLVGLFDYNLVADLFGAASIISRIIYSYSRYRRSLQHKLAVQRIRTC